jgi:hypothetical protein
MLDPRNNPYRPKSESPSTVMSNPITSLTTNTLSTTPITSTSGSITNTTPSPVLNNQIYTKEEPKSVSANYLFICDNDYNI